METDEIPLYRSVAERISALIEYGTYKPGERLPSIRSLSRQMRVSINTVKSAYDLLEVSRAVAPRPQSGYYVRKRLPEVPTAAPINLDSLVPTEAATGRLAALVHQDIGRPDLLMLGAAVPPVEALPSAQLARLMAREIQARPEDSIRYRIPPGEPRLREQIARCMLEAGCLVAPDEVVVTAGCQEAVSLALLALCAPGDTVAIESPAYFSFIQQLERLRLKGIEIPSTPADGVSLEALDYALGRERVTACLFTPNFSNPLGSLMPDENKRRLLDILERHHVPLIEDDIYGDLSHSPERPRAAKSFDTTGNVILCSSFSKSLCPGYRVGWIIAGRWQEKVEHIKMTLGVATSAPAQMAVAAYLSTGAYVRHIRRIRQLFGANVRATAEALGEAFPAGTRVTRPEGGMVLWVEAPPPFDSVELFEAARSHGISIAPGPIFSLTGKYRNAVRINAARWSAEIEQAVRTLGELAHRQQEGSARRASSA